MRLAVTGPAVAIVGMTLAACSFGPETPKAPEPPLHRPQTTATAASLEPCGGADLAGAVGGRLVEGDAAGPGEVSLMTLPQPYRIVAPGRATDLSFQPDRLTVTLAGDGTIRQLTCG